jgi:adenylate cyclase
MSVELEARHSDKDLVFWRRPLPEGPVGLRRKPEARGDSESGSEADGVEANGQRVKTWWDVDDETLSRSHAVVEWQGERLVVRRVLTPRKSRNPLYFRWEVSDEFTMQPGEFFVTGKTVFGLVKVTSGSPPMATGGMRPPTSPQLTEMTMTRADLDRVQISPNQKIEALRDLPKKIRFATDPEELEQDVLQSLLTGIPSATSAAIVVLHPESMPDAPVVEVRRSINRNSTTAPGTVVRDFQPARTLVYNALARDHSPVGHVWDKAQPVSLLAGGDMPSLYDQSTDWAVCAPLPEDSSPGWGLYVSGRFPYGMRGSHAQTDPEMTGAIAYTALTADIFGSLRQVLVMKKREVQLGNFLSPAVVRAVAGRDINEVLKPQTIPVTVMLCDLRGSSRIAEEWAEDLEGLLEKVSAALDVMTTFITEYDGVIGDFQGDSALGFWGWPFDYGDQIERAARAALAIRREFAKAAAMRDPVLKDFACGIGLAHGRCIAGRIGTLDQFKVGVFGPVVNLAARLEGLTKKFKVPIIVDKNVADGLEGLKRTGQVRTRRLAMVQPAGMKQVHDLFEVLPPAAVPGTLPENQRVQYENGLRAFLDRRWTQAAGLLRPLSDGPSELLKEEIARGPNGQPPADWPGHISFESK